MLILRVIVIIVEIQPALLQVPRSFRSPMSPDLREGDNSLWLWTLKVTTRAKLSPKPMSKTEP